MRTDGTTFSGGSRPRRRDDVGNGNVRRDTESSRPRGIGRSGKAAAGSAFRGDRSFAVTPGEGRVRRGSSLRARGGGHPDSLTVSLGR